MKYPILVLVLALGCDSADSAAEGSGEAGPGLDAPLEELLDTASSSVDSLDDIADPELSDSLDADPDGSDASTKADAEDSEDCVQVFYPDVKIYPGEKQNPSTYRPCL